MIVVCWGPSFSLHFCCHSLFGESLDMDELEHIKQMALKDLENLRDLVGLESRRVQHLGRSAPLSQFLRSLKDRTEEERRHMGQVANRIRDELEERYAAARDTLLDSAEELAARLDVTAPGRHVRRGHVHPLTQAQEAINDIFTAMGFRIVEGPEVETDFTNFDALN